METAATITTDISLVLDLDSEYEADLTLSVLWCPSMRLVLAATARQWGSDDDEESFPLSLLWLCVSEEELIELLHDALERQNEADDEDEEEE